MSLIVDTPNGKAFLGTVDRDADLAAAAAIAEACSEFARDEDDECYTEGCRSCFDCRHRRWVADGFSCMRNLLR